MRSKNMQKKEKAELRLKMIRMVNEANSLRDEAAEKLYDVPKGYKLMGARDSIRFWLMSVLCVGLSLGFLRLLEWSMDGGEDVAHIAVAIACMLFLGIGMVKASAAKNRPYKVEEHMQDYYANEVHCNALAEELERLKTGIADYDRQYEEQKEYIQKFIDHHQEVGDYGCMIIVLKANDFHARVKMTAEMDDVDCRLKFNETGYKQLTDLLNFFNNGRVCV